MAVVKLRLYAQNAQLSFLIHNVVMLSPNFHGSHGKMLATPPTLVFFWSRGVKTISTGNENAKQIEASAKGGKTQRGKWRSSS